MNDVASDKERYRAQFAVFEDALGPAQRSSFVHALRSTAFARFGALGFPTARLEDWRTTPVTAIARTPFELAPAAVAEAGAEAGAAAASRVAAVAAARVGAAPAIELVFVNGALVPALSKLDDLPPGLRVRSLARASSETPALVEPHVAQVAVFESEAFVALNTAFLGDGAFVEVAAGAAIETPVHLLFLALGGPAPVVCHARCLVVLGEAAQLTLVETYAAPGDGVTLTTAVSEAVLGQGAVLERTKVQRESAAGFHVASFAARAGRQAQVTTRAVLLGGPIVRDDILARLADDGAACALDGLFVATDGQLVDSHTNVIHERPHTTSLEFYKGILDGTGRGVFNGRIAIEPEAPQANAAQTNKNLILSGEAQIFTKPHLVIRNNDVKCSHGATVGQLDEAAVFYLRSRGIGLADARLLLTRAFAGEMLDRIRVPALRAGLEALISGRLASPAVSVAAAPKGSGDQATGVRA